MLYTDYKNIYHTLSIVVVTLYNACKATSFSGKVLHLSSSLKVRCSPDRRQVKITKWTDKPLWSSTRRWGSSRLVITKSSAHTRLYDFSVSSLGVGVQKTCIHSSKQRLCQALLPGVCGLGWPGGRGVPLWVRHSQLGKNEEFPVWAAPSSPTEPTAPYLPLSISDHF